MSIFKSLAASARAAHDHYFGGTATLAEPGTATRTVDVVLGKATSQDRREDNRDVRVTVRHCRFVNLTTVRHDAVVTVGGIDWSIDQIFDLQASSVTCQLIRRGVTDTNRTGYRGKG